MRDRAIEYGRIAAGISVAIIAVVKDLGTKLKLTFSPVSHSHWCAYRLRDVDEFCSDG